jgi:GntR family transcriptional repressor for pyruvate dehydrogenase complex
MFKTIKRTKVSDEIVNQIKTKISEGMLKPGERLLPERELVKEFGVSRPSLREALNSLVTIGFLGVKGKRTFVKSVASESMQNPLSLLIKTDTKKIFDLIEVRKALETWNAYFAAKRATVDDIALLEELIESMRKTVDEHGTAFEELDVDLHLAIARATHNTLQAHLMFSIHDTLKEFIGRYFATILRDDKNIFDQHTKIVEAIKNKAPDLARREIFRHLEYVESRVKELIQSEKGSSGSNS